MLHRCARTRGFWVLVAALSIAVEAVAQAPRPAPKRPSAGPSAAAAPASATPRPAATADSSVRRSGPGWQTAPTPAWVVAPPPAAVGVPVAPDTGGQRDQLVDIQDNRALAKPTLFVRLRSMATNASGLGQVSQPQITFNPAYQSVSLHALAVVRDGRRMGRLAEARIEPMRREQRLEQQVIDGIETLLVVLNDVRVGDSIELAYSIEGENPLFAGKVSATIGLAFDTAVDLLHYRLVAPGQRTLHTRTTGSDLQPERLSEGGLQVLRVVRHQVAPVVREQNTPPWFRVYPAIDVTEYTSWAEVDAWAQQLFALPATTAADVARQAAALRTSGLTGSALVSEVLRFVQDEVRYFSVSLGESSHRPKAPERTLAERLGDCKDKVVLLNALLRELGFDAKPALVSMRRNRSVADFLPTHDQFDHVISRVELNGKVWYLDPTISGQGLELESRGQFPYGRALVVGSGQPPQAVPEPLAATNRIEYEQLWDLTKPGEPARLEIVLRAHGFGAEQWRAGLASVGRDGVAKALAGGFARALPTLSAVGTADVRDDRNANRFELRQRFEMPAFGRYERGSIEAEFLALELLDHLIGPSETQRSTPYLVDQPLRVDSRIVVSTPFENRAAMPAPIEIADKHFRYTVKMEARGRDTTFTRRFERLSDQVLPSDLSAWRDKILRARQTTSGSLRMPLIDNQALMPEIEQLDRRLRAARGWRADALQGIIVRNELARLGDTRALERIRPGSPLAADVLASRATANNLLGDFKAGLADADAVLSINPGHAEALEVRGAALLGLNQPEAALAALQRSDPATRSASTSNWIGAIQLLLGRAADAEATLREVVAKGSGEEREFAAIWLYLAAERQGVKDRSGLAELVSAADPAKWTGALLRYLAGGMDRQSLLKRASEKADMERLNLAEAYFFIGQQQLAQGQRDEALKWFQRTVDTRAVPYREVTFAQFELQRAQGK